MRKKILITVIAWMFSLSSIAQTYLPLTAGSSNAVTGNLFLNADTYHYANMRFANGSGLYGDNSNHPDWLVTSSGWSTNGSINAATLSLAGTLTGTSATFSAPVRSGSLEIQSAGLNNAWYGENIYFDGSGFKYRANGYASMLYLENGEFQFRTSSTGTAGNPVSLIQPLTIKSSGNVGIGTTTPDSKLTVAGKIHSQEVKVTINAGADFVFNDDYKLRSLTETEQFIKTNKHLPEIASADEMKQNGLELGQMNIKLLQKIEELTLYVIDLKKENEKQGKAIADQQKEINQLKSKP